MGPATEHALKALDSAVSEASHADRSALVVALAARLATLGIGLAPTAPARTEPRAVAWITPEDAARIAGLPLGVDDERIRSVRRIYSWARGKPWATRPTRRCLRISEHAFRKWLEASRA